MPPKDTINRFDLQESGDFGGKGPRKLRKPFQQVQHNCNKLFSNTFCYCSNTLQMLVGRRGLEPRTT